MPYSNMRVMHVFAPAPVGGAEQVVLDLTKALAAAGAEVHLVPVLDEGAVNHPFLNDVPAEVFTHPLFLPARAYRRERQSLQALMESIEPQVVHTHGYRPDVVGASAARGLGIPVVSTAHGFTGSGWKISLYKTLQRWSLRRADAVVAVSKPLATQLQEMKIPPARIQTIINTRIPPDRLLSPLEARRSLDVSQEAFHIGWLGRMSFEKAPDIALEALEHLRNRGRVPWFLATMIGDGPLRGPLDLRGREAGLSEQIRWPGSIPGAARLLPGFDVLMLSSRTEGTPIVALEAMTLGIPLIATRVGGVPDLTGTEGALLVPPEDPLELAKALEYLCSDPAATSRRVEAAKRRVRERHAPETWAEAYLSVYRSALAGSTPT